MGYSDSEIISSVFALTAINGFCRSFKNGGGLSIKKAGKEVKRLYVRPLVYMNNNVIGLGAEMEPELLLAVVPMGHYLPEKKEGIDVMLFPEPRVVSFPGLKTASGYQIAIYAKRKTGIFNSKSERKCPETIFKNKDGYIVEGSGENIVALIDGELITPRPSDGALPGITVRIVSYIAEKLGINFKFGRITPDSLDRCEGIFLTGNAAGIVPVKGIAEANNSYDLKKWYELDSGMNETVSKVKEEYERIETWQSSSRFHTFMEDWYTDEEIGYMESLFEQFDSKKYIMEYEPPYKISDKFLKDSLWINKRFSIKKFFV